MSEKKITIAEHVREVRTKKPINNVVTGDVVGGDVVKDGECEEDAERGENESSESSEGDS